MTHFCLDITNTKLMGNKRKFKHGAHNTGKRWRSPPERDVERAPKNYLDIETEVSG